MEFLTSETFTSLLRFHGDGLGYKIVKRTLDVVISLVVLIISSPIIFLIAIIIKIFDPGHIFFKQYRIGLLGREFLLYKFRTMYKDAKERFPELYEYNYSEEELGILPVQRKDDPRVTRVGKWLRRTSFDELPNFINVLKGDMHLVGPRPDIWENIRHYPKDHLRKLSIKPGMTCIAQINGRGKLSFFQTNIYDLEYLENRSLTLDFKILYKTILVIIKRDGAF